MAAVSIVVDFPFVVIVRLSITSLIVVEPCVTVTVRVPPSHATAAPRASEMKRTGTIVLPLPSTNGAGSAATALPSSLIDNPDEAVIRLH
jgi:hypothetical protein